MFIIPYFSMGFRMAWMAITYNLFAALANPIYSNSHYLMVSLSTRDLDQRGKLSVVANIPAVAGNGLVSSILMPAILGWIKSGEALGMEMGIGQQIVQCFVDMVHQDREDQALGGKQILKRKPFQQGAQKRQFHIG